MSFKYTFSNFSRVRLNMLQGITRTEQAGLLPHHHHHHHHHHHQPLSNHHGIGTGSAWPPNHHDDLAHKGKFVTMYRNRIPIHLKYTKYTVYVNCIHILNINICKLT